MGQKSEVPVTVLMPVRNGAEWISASLNSLLDQDYANFEILLIDDESTDNSIPLAREIAGNKMRIVKAQGQGLARALAMGVQVADTELIIRLDVDDQANRLRLSKQIFFLEQNPDHVLVGSNVNLINNKGIHVGGSRFPLTDPGIRLRMILGNPFAHSSVTFRRSAVLEAGNYWSPDAQPFPEDYHLWCRLANVGLLANLAEPLVDYRIHESGLAIVNKKLMRLHSSIISWDWFLRQGFDQNFDSALKQAWRACFGESSTISLRQAFMVTRALISARRSMHQTFNDHGIRFAHYLTPTKRMFRGS